MSGTMLFKGTLSCNHCWHGNGIVLTSHPPQYPEVCCHCGHTRIRVGVIWPSAERHGPFNPNRFLHADSSAAPLSEEQS